MEIQVNDLINQMFEYKILQARIQQFKKSKKVESMMQELDYIDLQDVGVMYLKFYNPPEPDVDYAGGYSVDVHNVYVHVCDNVVDILPSLTIDIVEQIQLLIVEKLENENN